MLQIEDLTYRIAGRTLFDGASAFIARGWKVGLVGRNGTGKSTLLKLIQEEAGNPGGAIRIPPAARLGFVAQEAPPIETPVLAFVLEAHAEMDALLKEADIAEDPQRIADIHLRLGELDAYSAEARASSILTGLGFDQDDLQRPCREFSGGWRMRAALAGVLFAQPDILVLDEPTNYLDLEGAAWLEEYLSDYPETVIVVSHDRDMLNRSVTHILALNDSKLEVHPGGYDTYLRKRAERAANLGAQKAKQDIQRAHLQAFVDRFRAKASKARQAQSRIKMLERMTDISVPLEDRTVPFKFPDPEELASPLVVLDEADLGYVNGRPVLNKVSFRLDHDDRIVIIGPNGQGKTTLVKSIAGKLALLKGNRVASRAVEIGYFSQDQLDELRTGESVLQHIRDLAPNATPAAHRAIAAQIGFGAEKVDTHVERLSGGEKVRLLLGMLAFKKPHVLVLDEPTSHLDIDSREALIHAINGFSGAVLLITHDVYLAEACADRLWLVHSGKARPYDGDLGDYRKLVLASDRPRDKAPAPAKSAPKPPASGVKRSGLQKAVEQAEADLARFQALVAQHDAALAAPNLYANGKAKAERLAAERANAAAALEVAELAWLEAQAALEAAE
ncbi:MAG: ABC-F family ATP-binding cassette domain-containing protein [Caulobacterales bacterium]